MLQNSGYESNFEEFLFSIEQIYGISNMYIIDDVEMLRRFKTSEILLGYGFTKDKNIDISLITKSLKIISNLCESDECCKYFVSIGVMDLIHNNLFSDLTNKKVILNIFRISINIASSGYHELVLEKITIGKVIQVLTIYYQYGKIYSLIGQLVFLLSFVSTQETFQMFLKIIDFSLAKVNIFSNYWVFCTVVNLIKSPETARKFISSNEFVNFLNEAFQQEEIEIWEPAIRIVHALYYYIDDLIEGFDYSCFIKMIQIDEETIVELALRTIANIMTSDDMTELMINLNIVPLLTITNDKTYSVNCSFLNALTNAIQTCYQSEIYIFINNHSIRSLINGLEYEKKKLCLKIMKSINRIFEIEPDNEIVQKDFYDCFDEQIFDNILNSSCKELSDYSHYLSKTYPNYFNL